MMDWIVCWLVPPRDRAEMIEGFEASGGPVTVDDTRRYSITRPLISRATSHPVALVDASTAPRALNNPNNPSNPTILLPRIIRGKRTRYQLKYLKRRMLPPK